MPSTEPAILCYMPVLHDGYRHFIATHPEAQTIYLLDLSIAHKLRALQKDIRALPTESICAAVQALFPDRNCIPAKAETLTKVAEQKTPLIVPYEEVTRHVIATYLPENEVEFSSIFLRWDRETSTKKVAPSPTDTLSLPEFVDHYMAQAYQEAAKSSDWWRQVGAVAVKDGQMLLTAYNTHLPSEQQQYIVGDPRASFSSGVEIEITSSIHAEAGLIATAARRGISLAGSTLYSSTFPCPPCAKLIAQAGISRLCYADGYSLLDGESVLRAAGVEVIQMKPE